MPNPLAFLVLFLWPIVMLILFKRMPPHRALVWSMLGAFMFLPEKAYFDLPLVPQMNKYSLPSVTALLLMMTVAKQKVRLLPQSRIAAVLLVVLVLSPFGTVFTNLEPVFWGRLGLPPLSLRDSIGDFMRIGIIALPFILGYQFLATAEARQDFVKIFTYCGLIYSVPMVLETRLTPIFSFWFYGYFPDLFGQQIRFGGFRPVVFMGHGLIVATFALLAATASAVLLRGAKGSRSQYIVFLVYLMIVLILCKTLGAIVLALLFIPLVLFSGTRLKGWAILVCATFVLTYPVLRANEMVPTETLLDYARMVQEERAGSLYFRFFNEDVLLARASEKPWFGWGSWLRNHVFDPETGDLVTVTDGYWIIIIGTMGWVGYICVFGLFTLPLFRLFTMRKRGKEFPDAAIIYGIALMLAANLVDLIPNSSQRPMTWLMAGMLLAVRPGLAPSEEDDDLEDVDNTPKPVHVRKRRDGTAAPAKPPLVTPHAETEDGFARRRR